MTSQNIKPLFITFEGGEGAGKSTQIALLYQSLLKQGIKAICTREPGGTKSAEIIRNILVNGKANKWHPKTELLLHMAARTEHVEFFIKPHIQNNYIVICDRFIDSTVAYQGYGHGLDQELIRQVYELLIGKFYPDITIILNVAVKDGMQRIHNAHDNSRPDRYENMGEAFHQRVLKGFQNIAKSNPERYITVDAGSNIEQVHQAIINALNYKFKLNLLPIAR